MQIDHLREPRINKLLPTDKASRSRPLLQLRGFKRQQLRQQSVEIFLKDSEVTSPFGRFFKPNVFLALPPDRVKQH